MIKFGTDGWRAVIADEYTFENVKALTQAVCEYLKQTHNKKDLKVVVGYDRRFLSKEFGRAVAWVRAANNIGVLLFSKEVPTPLVSFITSQKSYDLGIMITASHNPYAFNGFKIKTKQGGTAGKDLTDIIEQFVFKKEALEIDFKEAEEKGLIQVLDMSSEYINFLKNFVDIDKLKSLRLKILVDLMHGSGGDYLSKVLKGTSIDICYLHGECNPSFGGNNPEPLPDNLKECILKTKEQGYDLAVCLDGDGDRIAMITGEGEYIDAQVLLPLLSIHMIRNRNQKAGIAKTVVGSNLIDMVAHDLNTKLFETQVGFKHISHLLKEGEASIGGEEAGGLGFYGYIPERDGTLSALLVLEMMAFEGSDFISLLNSLWKKYGKWYYRKTKIELNNIVGDLSSLKLPKSLLGEQVERVNTIDGVKMITSSSWLMFRKSGTEPIVRVYAESQELQKTMQLLSLGEGMIRSLK